MFVSNEAYTAASFANATEMVDAIITERRIEFLAEGMRWNDIHRLLYDDLVPTPGIPAKVAYCSYVYSGYAIYRTLRCGDDTEGRLQSAVAIPIKLHYQQSYFAGIAKPWMVTSFE